MYPGKAELTVTMADQVVVDIRFHEEGSMVALNVAYTVDYKHEHCIENKVHQCFLGSQLLFPLFP